MDMIAAERPVANYAGAGFGRGGKTRSRGFQAVCGSIDRLLGAIVETAAANPGTANNPWKQPS
jgi:hypothetical protein